MDSKWLAGHSDRDRRRKEIKSYRNAFDELSTLLKTHYEKKEAVRDYSSGWEYKQIAVNEYNQVLSDILNLIDIKEK